MHAFAFSFQRTVPSLGPPRGKQRQLRPRCGRHGAGSAATAGLIFGAGAPCRGRPFRRSQSRPSPGDGCGAERGQRVRQARLCAAVRKRSVRVVRETDDRGSKVPQANVGCRGDPSLTVSLPPSWDSLQPSPKHDELNLPAVHVLRDRAGSGEVVSFVKGNGPLVESLGLHNGFPVP